MKQIVNKQRHFDRTKSITEVLPATQAQRESSWLSLTRYLRSQSGVGQGAFKQGQRRGAAWLSGSVDQLASPQHQSRGRWLRSGCNFRKQKGLRKQEWELGKYPKDNREPICGFKEERAFSTCLFNRSKFTV